MELKPNIPFISLRFIIVSGIAAAVPFGTRHFLQTGETFSLCMFLFLGALIGSEYGTSVFFRPVSLRITADEVTTRYFFWRKRAFSPKEICGYSTTVFSSRIRDFPGIILYTRSGFHPEISRVNVKSVAELAQVLDEMNIPNFGTEESHFSVFPRKYMYDDWCT